MIGLRRDVIKLVPHNKDWARAFETEKKKIMGALKKYAAEVEHIGSTSVPGLQAKPIIDILVGVKNMSDVQACVTPLRKIGYRKVRDVGDERLRLFFVKGGSKKSTHHLHVVKWNGKLWKAHTSFSCYLRTNRTWAKKYHTLKHNLAKKFQNDREKYTRGKGVFVRMIITRVRKQKNKKS